MKIILVFTLFLYFCKFCFAVCDYGGKFTNHPDFLNHIKNLLAEYPIELTNSTSKGKFIKEFTTDDNILCNGECPKVKVFNTYLNFKNCNKCLLKKFKSQIIAKPYVIKIYNCPVDNCKFTKENTEKKY